ncbi:ESCRT-1 complex, Vps28 subunit [Metschnikowia bicuspidata var. bicuspidata NRRL YB-4993]|uniref:ESCRT-1 complex, Vps28 subunit n=1 Tax=Metschnikowia bicuspidata var. bicuspidata NRRL YB-4993 TaxID=869754 RepID=A0A1A0HI87_9ASCO|nr:ESCRT-1 complex, Vps28 subunit [Metschnikowia bicuspidata var. bicuspidata NRRL YB-4993]OBA23553.1 ESCRT-1 complex, Vps28 subunit [Metschnikowia bicuspidata var. bicuspidata NRRL YB-4993]
MSAPPAYAPTTNSTYTLASEQDHSQHHGEISRASFVPTSIHKAVYDSLCELYSIVTVTETVENAFVKDFVTDKEKYTSTIMRLVNQCQILLESFHASPTHEKILREILPDLAGDHSNLLRVVAAKFSLHAPLAIDRLTKKVPATIEHFHKHVELAEPTEKPAASEAASGLPARAIHKLAAASARLVAEATGNFITLMDAVKLNYNTKLQLHPLLSNLVISLNELVTRENSQAVALEFPGKLKLVSWLIKLNNLSDNDTLSSDDLELFLLDLDTSYHGFYDSLE